MRSFQWSNIKNNYKVIDCLKEFKKLKGLDGKIKK